MKKILIPFDFSEISTNALRFALNLYPESEFKILHVAYRGADLDKPSFDGHGVTQKMVLTESVQAILQANVTSVDQLENIEIVIENGSKVEQILRHAKMFADGIMMGTRDSYGLLDRWIGTVSLGVVKQSNVPVYLIPKFSNVRNFENILVASDFHLNSKLHLQNLIDWNKNHLAHLSFVHLKESYGDDFIEEKDNIVNRMFEEGKPQFSFDIISKRVYEGPSALLSIAYNNKSDLIVLIPSKQNLLDTIFFKSFTKEILLKSSIPLLFFPNNGYAEKNVVELVEEQQH